MTMCRLTHLIARSGCWREAALIAGALVLAACRAPAAPTSLPVATQVAQRLTATALAAPPTPPPPSPTLTATASPTASATRPSPTPSNSPTPAGTATPTGTPTTPPRPTVELGSLPYPPATFGGEPHSYFGSPVSGAAFIASAYRYGSVGSGQRFAPHHGVDFSAPAGTPLVAVAPGTIFYAGSDLERAFGPQTDFYGNLVVLQLAQAWNGRTVYALYGHMDEVIVTDGQTVAAGDPLGTVGATGVALGPHPHLEVRLDQPESYWETRNPELWLAPAGGYGALALRVTNAAGFYLPGVRVDFTCSDGAPRFMETYWYSGVNPDDAYGENAAMTNIPPGYCDFTAEAAGQTVEVDDAYVSAGQITFVSIRMP